MGLTGKYDFKGIKKVGGAGIRVALSHSPYTAWILKWGSLTTILTEALANWFANKGLVLFNLGAIYVEGEIDQEALDSEMDRAISEIQLKGGKNKLTAAERKAIDDGVIKAARKFIVIGKS